MAYDLTIDRVGALVGSRPGSNSPNLTDVDEIAATFRKQAESLGKQLDQAAGDLLSAAKAVPGAKQVEWVKKSDGDFDDDDGFIDIVTKEPRHGNFPRLDNRMDGTVPPLLALMPSRRMRLTLSGMPWVMRTRATVTSCALQKTLEPTKLWWTFEGIPDDPKNEASEKDAAGFLELSRTMTKVAMPLLSKAYWTAFRAVWRVPTGFAEQKKMVRICMADANTREMAALVDAFARNARESGLREPGNAQLADARAGIVQLDAFIAEVAHKEQGWVPSDESIEISDLLRGARGILSRQLTADNDPLLVGFARRLGARVSAARLPDDLRAPTRTESYLRAISAARPLSARIADLEARRIGGVPTKGRPPHRLTA